MIFFQKKWCTFAFLDTIGVKRMVVLQKLNGNKIIIINDISLKKANDDMVTFELKSGFKTDGTWGFDSENLVRKATILSSFVFLPKQIPTKKHK